MTLGTGRGGSLHFFHRVVLRHRRSAFVYPVSRTSTFVISYHRGGDGEMTFFAKSHHSLSPLLLTRHAIRASPHFSSSPPESVDLRPTVFGPYRFGRDR